MNNFNYMYYIVYNRQLSIALTEDLSKPIKALAETQNKNRKPVRILSRILFKTI